MEPTRLPIALLTSCQSKLRVALVLPVMSRFKSIAVELVLLVVPVARSTIVPAGLPVRLPRWTPPLVPAVMNVRVCRPMASGLGRTPQVVAPSHVAASPDQRVVFAGLAKPSVQDEILAKSST